MANTGLLTQGMTVEQAQILDQRLRKERDAPFRQAPQNYGGGAMGGLLAASGQAVNSAALAGRNIGEFAGDAMTGRTGRGQENEIAAVERQDAIVEQTKKQKEIVISNLNNNPNLSSEAVENITKAVVSGVMSVEAASKLSVPTGNAPKTREIEKGDKLITQEWNTATQQWDKVASSDIGAKEVKAAQVAANAAKKQSDSKFGLQFIKNNKERIDKGMGAVEQSQKAVRTIDSAMGFLNKGVFTGTFSEAKVQFIKVADALFGKDIGIDKASSTEEFGIILLDNLGPLVKSGMFGTGQSITNKDLEIAKSMIAGDPSKTEGAIRGILSKLYVGNQKSLKATQEFMGHVAEIDPNYKRFTISKEAIEETQRVREFGRLTPDEGWVSITLNGHNYFTNKEGRLLDTQGYLIQPKKGG